MREDAQRDERPVIWASKVTFAPAKTPRHLRFEMFAPSPHRICNARTAEQEQAKLQKIKELTSILKVQSRDGTSDLRWRFLGRSSNKSHFSRTILKTRLICCTGHGQEPHRLRGNIGNIHEETIEGMRKITWPFSLSLSPLAYESLVYFALLLSFVTKATKVTYPSYNWYEMIHEAYQRCITMCNFSNGGSVELPQLSRNP